MTNSFFYPPLPLSTTYDMNLFVIMFSATLAIISRAKNELVKHKRYLETFV